MSERQTQLSPELTAILGDLWEMGQPGHLGTPLLAPNLFSTLPPIVPSNTPSLGQGKGAGKCFGLGSKGPHPSVGPSRSGSANRALGACGPPWNVLGTRGDVDWRPHSAQVSAQQGLLVPFRLFSWIGVAPLAHKFTRRHPNTPKGGEEPPTATCEHPSYW